MPVMIFAVFSKQSFFLSRSLFRSGDVQGGMESYQRAVAQYKLAGDWDSAAMTLTKMADIFRRQGDLMGAGRLHGEAGACYRKYSAHAAVQAYLKVHTFIQ